MPRANWPFRRKKHPKLGGGSCVRTKSVVKSERRSIQKTYSKLILKHNKYQQQQEQQWHMHDHRNAVYINLNSTATDLYTAITFATNKTCFKKNILGCRTIRATLCGGILKERKKSVLTPHAHHVRQVGTQTHRRCRRRHGRSRRSRRSRRDHGLPGLKINKYIINSQ